ncbi:EAL domain-containing protein [Nakamurella sp. YIM 132087]|uniref:EAL domain-containing protein n=1 Tax=Nakamurella alba TaxID=2665158 RepID=A0A7K1FKW3_9ACTN|nr:EAL domain-containing protein [Nakamurella alba]MTD14781.1 EAL domain-containing protein [Nakamurella alba]
MSRRAFRIAVLLSVSTVLICAVLLMVAPDSTLTLWVDDLAQLIPPWIAAGFSVVAARRSQGRMRWTWRGIAVAAAGWGSGQLIWCWYELVLGADVPAPSLADIGYLLLPIGAAFGLVAYPGPAGSSASRLRSLLDGCIVGAALVAVLWPTLISDVVAANEDSAFALAVALAYPIGDMLLLTMVVSAVTRPTPARSALGLLSAALTCMAVADIGFLYLNTTTDYNTGAFTDLGWIAGLLLLALAAMAGTQDDGSGTTTAIRRPATPVTALPYVPLLFAALVITVEALEGRSPGGTASVAFLIGTAAVLARQYLSNKDNHTLLQELASREEQLEKQAFYDQLTGLANRGLFGNRVAHALELHARDLRPLAVVFIDLDDFKAVNDTYGHGAGDELLVRVSERLHGAVRRGDTVARFGGDEFAVLLEDGGEGTFVASRIIDALREPFALSAGIVSIGASVGVSEVLPEQQSPSLDRVLAQADMAMYSAKRAGKGQLALYDTDMVLPEAADLQLRPALVKAVQRDEITAVFQPIIDLSDGRIVEVETLARWTHSGEAIPPDYFVPLAGRAGVLSEFTDLMLGKACAALHRWSVLPGGEHTRISVNLPPALVVDPELPGRVARILRQEGIAPARLTLELTEDALVDDPATAKSVTGRLEELGVELSVDDFGKGYSSLLSLRQIALHAVKIDRAFVANLDQDREAERFLNALLVMGRELELAVTAEGVERPEQARILMALGCHRAQGNLFSPPLPAAELGALLASGGTFAGVAGVPGRATPAR